MPPAVPLSRRVGEQLRSELLVAARVLVAAPRPITVPSLRAVARACGVSPTAVYRHFPSQSALTRAVLVAEHEAFVREVLGADDVAADPYARLRRLAIGYVQWGLSHPGPYQLLFESADQLGQDWTVVEAPDQVTALLIDLMAAITRGRPTPLAPRVLGERLWTQLHGLVSLRMHKPAHAWTAEWMTEIVALLEHNDLTQPEAATVIRS